jgi:predicted methyltransferase
VDEEEKALDRMVEQQAISWPQIWESKGFEGAIPKQYSMDGTPLLYLVDRAGRIAGRFRSVRGLDAHISEALAAPAAAPRNPRDQWQRPYAVMDRLGIQPGSVVADIGSGEGYFTLRLAARVGAEGKVYAVDIDSDALGKLRERAQADGLTQVTAVLGAADDPKLPPESVDAVLIVDAYHEFTAHDAMLKSIWLALKPGGRLGILDMSDALGRPRSEYQQRHRLPVEMLIADAAPHGFRLKFHELGFAGHEGEARQYLAVFEKPKGELNRSPD